MEGAESRSYKKQKFPSNNQSLIREIHILQTEHNPSQKAIMAWEETLSTDSMWAISESKRHQNMGWLVLMGWVIP